MKTRRTPFIVGLVLALGTGILLLNFLTQAHKGTSTAEMRSVVIALKEIPARAQITPDMVGSGSRAVDQVDPDALADSHLAVGKMALITIPVGSTLTASKVITPAALALPARLRDGLRAVSISIDKVKGVSGLIQPGDRVDVIAVSPRDGGDIPQASTILRGVLVLALGNETETASATPAPDNQALTTVTLAVTPQQANLLALGDVYTTLRLALRSSNEPLRSFPTEPLAWGAPVAGPPVSAPVVPAPGPVAAAPRRRLPPYVQVINGDEAAPRPDAN